VQTITKMDEIGYEKMTSQQIEPSDIYMLPNFYIITY